MKITLKSSIGTLWLASTGRQRLRGTSVVLMLHRVLAQNADAALPHNNPLCLGQRAFVRLLRFLQRHFSIVTLEQALEQHDGPPRLALTFDDGWKDNVLYAFPVLQRKGIPASIFLSTGYIGQPRGFWWESIGDRFWQEPAGVDNIRLQQKLSSYGISVPEKLYNNEHTLLKSRLILDFLGQLKNLPPFELNELAAELFHKGESHAMDWSDVRALEDSGLIRFGPHGHDHYILTRLEPEACVADIRRSHELIREHCRLPLNVYCYPNGNHSPVVQQAVRDLGYSHALATHSGLIEAGVSAYALPRVDVSQQAATRTELMAWRIMQGARAAP